MPESSPAPSLSGPGRLPLLWDCSRMGVNLWPEWKCKVGSLSQLKTSPHKEHPWGERDRQLHDSRFSILDKKFFWPISPSIRRWSSTGCSGTSPSLPTTPQSAAHCVHDGSDHIKGSKSCMSRLAEDEKIVRGGKRRRGSRRNRREVSGAGREGSQDSLKETAKAGRRERGSARGQRVADGGPPSSGPGSRTPTSPRAGLEERVETRPWTMTTPLLELKRPHKKKYMDLGVSPTIKKLPGGMIHFRLRNRQGRSVSLPVLQVWWVQWPLYQYCEG